MSGVDSAVDIAVNKTMSSPKMKHVMNMEIFQYYGCSSSFVCCSSGLLCSFSTLVVNS